MLKNSEKTLIENHCPSPDSNGNPFVTWFGTKDWKWIAGIASDKIPD